MVKRMRLFVGVGVFIAACVSWMFLRGGSSTEFAVPQASPLAASPSQGSVSESGEAQTKPANVRAESPSSAQPTDTDTDTVDAGAKPARSSEGLTINSQNFEGYVNRCFQGEPCEFEENPIAMYKAFKNAGNESACDRLISFLRSKMKDQKYRERFKSALKTMIDDFYPATEKPFQMAAYHNYLGELSRSLELYLELERNSKTDSTLRPAPKLNIANTYFDLQRYKESLPYYEAALSEFLNREQEVSSPTRNEMIRFLEERIIQVKNKITANTQ